LNGVMETGIPGVAAADFVSQSGDTAWHQINVYPAPEGLLCISIDVSERKRQESALQENAESYRALIENSSDIIQIIDSEGIIRYLSPSVEGMLGYKPEELIGRRSVDIVHPDDLQAVARDFEEAFHNPGVPVVTECRCKHKDGTWRVLEGTGTNYLNRPGINGFLSNLHDTTGRHRAEEALKESEERHRNIIENASDTITVHSLDGTYVSLNRAFEATTGWSDEEWIGRPFSSIVHPEDLPLALKMFDVASSQGLEALHTPTLEVRILCKSGDYVLLEITGTPYIRNGELVGFVAVGHDITQRKQAEERLQAAYEQEKKVRRELEDEARIRVEFLRALVHELKTPVTSVMASSDLLTMELPKGPLLDIARNLRRGAENLDKRIDELLDLARGELGLLQLNCLPVEPLPLLRQVVDDMAPVVSSHGHRLVLEVPPNLPTIWGNEGRLRQVMFNLINNADKFSRAGGLVTLRARTRDSMVIVEVQDTGEGISEEQHKRLFNAYDRLLDDRERMSGLGIGLALCKVFVELHGGQIWVRSKKGEGSTFSFSVPLMTEADLNGGTGEQQRPG